MKYSIVPSLLIAFTLGFSAGCMGQGDEKVTPIHYQELKEMLARDSSIQFIDVRTPEEFKEGSIPTARNMNFQDPRFPNMVATLDRSRPLYIFCQSGNRSARAARMLHDLGFEQIYEYQGGYRDWSKQTRSSD